MSIMTQAEKLRVAAAFTYHIQDWDFIAPDVWRYREIQDEVMTQWHDHAGIAAAFRLHRIDLITVIDGKDVIS